MAEERVRVKIDASQNVTKEANAAGAAIKNLDKTTKTATNGISSSFSKAGVAAGIALAGFAAVAAGVKDLINTYKAQEQAEAKLEAVIRATGGAAGYTANEMKAMAGELQSVTVYGDEAIINAQALLSTFTRIGRETFPDATEAVLNMSSVLGQDLSSSAQQLGKALQDPVEGVTALRRVGVRLTEQQEEQIRKFVELNDVAGAQKIILGELQTEFGGVARAIGETGTGAIEQFKNALGDAKEIGGQYLLEFIAPAIRGLTEFIKKQNEAAKDTRNLNDAISGKSGVDLEAAIEAQNLKIANTIESFKEANAEATKYATTIAGYSGQFERNAQGFTKAQQQIIDSETFRLELLEAQLETQIKQKNELDNLNAEEQESQRRAQAIADAEAERLRIQKFYNDVLTETNKSLRVIDGQITSKILDSTDEWAAKNSVVSAAVKKLLEEGFNPTAGFLDGFLKSMDTWITKQDELNDSFKIYVSDAEKLRALEKQLGIGVDSVTGVGAGTPEQGQQLTAGGLESTDLGRLILGENPLQVFIDAIASAALNVEEFAQAMNFIQTVATQVFNVLRDGLGNALNYVVVALQNVGTVIGSTLLPIISALSPIIFSVSSVFNSLLPIIAGVLNISSSLITFIIDVLSPAFLGLAITLEVLTAPLRFLGDLLTWLGNWVLFLGNSIAVAIRRLQDPIGALAGRYSDPSSPGGFASTAFSGLGDRIQAIIAGFNAAQNTNNQFGTFDNVFPELSGAETISGSQATIQRVPDIYITQNFNAPVVGAGLAEVGEFVVDAIQEFAGIGGQVTFTEA